MVSMDNRNEPAPRGGRLAGRKILITGAASGIGRATANLFAAEGASLALLDVKNPDEWEAGTPGELRLKTDLLDRAAIADAVRTAAERMHGIDGIVNCAALGGSKPIEQLEMEKWDQILAVNLSAPYLIIKEALPYLRASGRASIVNIGSGVALLPSAPGSGAYAASKGGLVSLTKALAYDLAPDIRVNAVLPGVTNTAMAMATVIAHFPDPNDAPFVQQYAMKRVAEPAEIANAILFMASHESSYVTGAILAADGGRIFH
jgi:NAD(P)-dependent dehydrogenase (short-subunit alcohol dehydrogenase family)